jgi:23S rRNA (adenine2503-C2)-methyltransferase
MNTDKIKEILKDEPTYRLKQVQRAVFLDLIDDWNEATNFSKPLREILNKECSLKVKARNFVSGDKQTIKSLITLEDNKKIEAVLMRHEDNRNTVCVSTQIGCPLACRFCDTGKMGFVRNLKEGEILEQVLHFARYLKKQDAKITNVVFMGMGEPFLNYNNVLDAIRVLNDKEGFNLGARRMTVSTVGITEGIDKLINENLQVNLAISLHASDEKLRQQLMPISKRYGIKKILKSVDKYIQATNRQVTFEYLLIRDVNDSKTNAKELVEIMDNPLYVVNLIRYNPTGGFKASPRANIEKFKKVLLQNKIKVTERYEFGQDIKAACGQLAGRE